MTEPTVLNPGFVQTIAQQVQALMDLAGTGAVVVDGDGNEAVVVSQEEWYGPWEMDVPYFYLRYEHDAHLYLLDTQFVRDFGPFYLKGAV